MGPYYTLVPRPSGVRVTFDYDEKSRKWEAWVSGTESTLESRQAFSAVVLTIQMLDPNLLTATKVEVKDFGHVIIPAV